VIEAILDELRGATSEEDVARIAAKHRPQWAEWSASADQDAKSKALRMENAKKYRIWFIRTGST